MIYHRGYNVSQCLFRLQKGQIDFGGVVLLGATNVMHWSEGKYKQMYI